MADRDTAVLTERIHGDTLRTIGARHSLTPEGVRVVFKRAAQHHLEDLEQRLAANAKTGDVEALLVPGLGGPDFDEAINYVRWVTHALAERGVQLQVHYRATPDGVVFGLGLEDVTTRTEST